MITSKTHLKQTKVSAETY